MQFRAGQFRDAACGLACDIRATPQAAKASRLAVLSLAIALGIAPLLLAQAPDKFPSAAEVTELLKKEPVSATTWPAWRERLLAWITDPGDGTNPAFDAARKFMRSQAGGKGTLPAEFAQDHLAWYLLGNELLFEHQEEADLREETRQAEAAQRRSIELDPKFAAAHRNLARCLLREEEIDRALGTEKAPNESRLAAVHKEIELAQSLNPALPGIKAIHKKLALSEERYADAANLLVDAINDHPNQAGILLQEAVSSVLANKRTDPAGRAKAMGHFVELLPHHGELACVYALALASNDDWLPAAQELQRARSLGIDPVSVLGAEDVKKIETAAGRAASQRFLKECGFFMLMGTAFYALVCTVMGVAALVLAPRALGRRSVAIFEVLSKEKTEGGRTLAHLWTAGLRVTLGLFYVAIPCILGSLSVVTGFLLAQLFRGDTDTLPIQLLFAIVVIGGLTWAFFVGLFTRPDRSKLGMVRKTADCPQLRECVNAVSQRLKIEPITEVLVTESAGIDLLLEARRPFGILGVKQRIPVLGLPRLRLLTVSELKAILAQKFAFAAIPASRASRRFCPASRILGDSLAAMREAGAGFNYVNPFFWLLVLYYRVWLLLAAGFLRAREFQADQLAAEAYGSDVLASALGKLALSIPDEADKELREDAMEKTNRFAPRPTLQDRLDALAALPRAEQPDSRPAIDLFENPQELEKLLHDFLEAQAQPAAAE